MSPRDVIFSAFRGYIGQTKKKELNGKALECSVKLTDGVNDKQ